MQLTGHKSVQGVQAYKQINENQQLHILKTLINITDSINKEKNNTSQNNSFNIHLKSQISFQEISSNFLEFDNQVIQNPVFNHCTYSNVSFYIQK